MYGGYPHREPIERGVKLVMSRQLAVSSVAVTLAERTLTTLNLGWLVGPRGNRGHLQ